MATSDVIKSMDGMGTNPGLFIRAPDYVCQGVDVVYNSAYFESRAVRGTFTGQKLFETPWYAAGTFNNIVIPMVYIEGDTAVTGTGTSASTQTDKLKITIYKRLPGSTTFTTTPIYVSYHSNVSNKIGQAPTSGAALDVEGIYLQYYVANSVTTGRQLKFGSYGETTLAQGIPVICGAYWTATTDGAGNLSIAIPSEYFPYSAGWTLSENASGSAPSSTGQGMRAVINAVDSVQTTHVSGTDIDAEWMMANYEVVDGSNGGYTIYFLMHSDNPSVQCVFYSQLFGYCGSMVV
jgi:hypothetical protein